MKLRYVQVDDQSSTSHDDRELEKLNSEINQMKKSLDKVSGVNKDLQSQLGCKEDAARHLQEQLEAKDLEIQEVADQVCCFASPHVA